MNIGIVTTAYNGYGRFARQWLEAIDKLKTKPTMVTIVLGHEHGLLDAESLEKEYKHLDLKIVRTVREPLMGPMRNVAVENTPTEWIMYLSIDDVILPGAIDELAKYEKDADYICIKWQSVATWRKGAKILTHNPKTPREMALKYNGKGFIVGHSPFRRSFWEKHPYQPHDYPNAPFIGDLVEAGARFVKTEEPCTMYLRRLDSHAARLGRRKSTLVLAEKKKANHWKINTERRIRRYYQKGK